jgi:2-methylcitrate dehydratase PrpD
MISVTDKFIESLYELTQIEFSEQVILQAKKCLLDYFGVTFAGAVLLKEKSNTFLNNSEIEDVSVIGFTRKNNLFSAALINGLSAHIAELDDGIRQGNFHPGAPIISALLPVAQHYKLSGNDLLKGIIVGYEAGIRLACAIQPSHRIKGYHAIGTCGAIGAALGIAAALGFSKQQMKYTQEIHH